METNAFVHLPPIDAPTSALHFRIEASTIVATLESLIGPAARLAGSLMPATVYLSQEPSEVSSVRFTVDGISDPSFVSGSQLGMLVPQMPSMIEIPVKGRLNLVRLLAISDHTAVQVLVQG